MNKTNKEIIVDEAWIFYNRAVYKKLEQLNGKLSSKGLNIELEHLIEDFASSLLAKLNKLNRENIEKIIFENSNVQEFELKENIKIAFRTIAPRGIYNIINQILSLIPEEGEVVAEAEIEKVFWIKDYNHLCFELGLNESLWIKEKDFPSPGKYTLILKKSK